MKQYKNFKQLLEYFVAHLEYCVTKNKENRGYDKYIKPFEESGSFKWSGFGRKEEKNTKPSQELGKLSKW